MTKTTSAEAGKSTSVGELLDRAEQIGRRLAYLGTWRARRLSKPAMLAQAIATAGVPDESALRTIAAKVNHTSVPYLNSLVSRITDNWLGADVWAPGFHGAFSQAHDGPTGAAYAERLSLSLSPSELSGVCVLRVHDDARATFGEAASPTAADDETAALLAELDQIDERLLDLICLRDLDNPSGTLRVGGRTFAFTRTLARDVAQAAVAA